jgi:hypothetical protein
LLAGTIDGRTFSALTLDQVTDLLGRPSVVQRSPAASFGPSVHYHEAGIRFSFSPRSEGERVLIVSVHLSKSRDKFSEKYYQPFVGQLTPAIDGNWKEERIMQLLAEHHPKMKSAEERQQESEKARRGPATELQDMITLRPEGDRRHFERALND